MSNQLKRIQVVTSMKDLEINMITLLLLMLHGVLVMTTLLLLLLT